MAMTAGDSACTTGMAKDIFDSVAAEDLVLPGTDEATLKKFLFAIAVGVVAHIASHAEAVIGTSLGGLQREDDHTGTTVDTQPPSAERSLPLR